MPCSSLCPTRAVSPNIGLSARDLCLPRPDHIPKELLTDGAPYWPTVLQPAADPFAFDQMLETLLAFSLVKHLTENHLLSIHGLVQAVQLERMDPEVQRQWAERVVFAMNAFFPLDPRYEIATWPLCLRYLEQVQACFTLIQELTLTLTEGADMLDRAGSYLCRHASYTLGEPLYQRALHIREQQLGYQHPFTAGTLYDLARHWEAQGNNEEACASCTRALAIRELAFGADHPKTTDTRTRLIALLHALGQHEQAAQLETGPSSS